MALRREELQVYAENLGDNLQERYFSVSDKNGLQAEVISRLIADEYKKTRLERVAKFEKEQEERKKMPAQEHLKYTDSEGFSGFMGRFFDVLNENRASFPHPQRQALFAERPTIWKTVFIEKSFRRMPEEMLDYLMPFEDVFIQDLKGKHQRVVASLPETAPTDLYKGAGYVMIGGGLYTFYAIIALQSLRRSGSKLPLELVFPDDHWEDWLCKEGGYLETELNARCVSFKQMYGEEALKKVGKLQGYQFKSFALLGSTFKDAMYLDSDNLAVMNPDHLFESELYKKYKMITWPDFWRRTTSPVLYPMLGIDVGSVPVRKLNDVFTDPDRYTTKKDLINLESEVNFHDRLGTLTEWTTEAGQFVINKQEHFNTLLLSLYYNYDGPRSYHPLISQGGAGEGDKETYVLAAHFLKKPYYQVYKKPDKLYGAWIKDSNWLMDSTIVQMDPEQDYDSLRQLVLQAEEDKGDDTYNYEYAFGEDTFESKPNQAMFYHVHAPKPNPFEFLKNDYLTDMDGNNMRNLGEQFDRLGFDLELWMWETMKSVLCEEKDGKKLHSFECFKKEDMNQVCQNQTVTDRIDWLRQTGETMLKHVPGKAKGRDTDEKEKKRLDDKIWGALGKSLQYGRI